MKNISIYNLYFFGGGGGVGFFGGGGTGLEGGGGTGLEGGGGTGLEGGGGTGLEGGGLFKVSGGGGVTFFFLKIKYKSTPNAPIIPEKSSVFFLSIAPKRE
jgi:hypothetical protein